MSSIGMTVDQIASEDLGCKISKNTIYDYLIKTKTVPYVSFGRSIRVPRSALIRFLDYMAIRHIDLCDTDAVRQAMDDPAYIDWMKGAAA